MRNLFFLLLIMLMVLSCLRHDQADGVIVKTDSLSYRTKCIAFFRQVRKDVQAGRDLVVLDIPVSLRQDGCLSGVLADSASFSPAERRYLSDNRLAFLHKWDSQLLPGSIVVSSDSIGRILKGTPREQADFFQQTGSAYHQFSLPVFLRNDTYCLFYSSYFCGLLCAEGRLSLYKKVGDRWEVVRRYCEWIS